MDVLLTGVLAKLLFGREASCSAAAIRMSFERRRIEDSQGTRTTKDREKRRIEDSGGLDIMEHQEEDHRNRIDLVERRVL